MLVKLFFCMFHGLVILGILEQVLVHVEMHLFPVL